MRGLLAVAVHIDRQGRVSQLGEHPGAFARVLVVSPHHSWTTKTPGRLPCNRVVIREITFERHALAL